MSDRTFYTYAPGGKLPNWFVVPHVFNGTCDVKRYRVTVEEVDGPEEERVRLLELWERRHERGTTHIDDLLAMSEEARRLEIKLPRSGGRK